MHQSLLLLLSLLIACFIFFIQRLSRSLPLFPEPSKSPPDLSREASGFSDLPLFHEPSRSPSDLSREASGVSDVPMRADSPDDLRRSALNPRQHTSIPSITHKIQPDNHPMSQPTLHESLHESQRVMAPALDASYTSASRSYNRDMRPAHNSFHDATSMIAQKWRAQSGQMAEMRHELELLRMQNANLQQSLTLERMQS